MLTLPMVMMAVVVATICAIGTLMLFLLKALTFIPEQPPTPALFKPLTQQHGIGAYRGLNGVGHMSSSLDGHRRTNNRSIGWCTQYMNMQHNVMDNGYLETHSI